MKNRTAFVGACALGLATAALGCTDKLNPSPDSPTTVSPQGMAASPIPEAAPGVPSPAAAAGGNYAAEAKTIFAQRCTMCHGLSGKGDGPASAPLSPHPRSFADASWQAGATDEAIKAIIVKGGDAVGKSMMMPGNPDLKDKPGVVDELLKMIRSFKK